MSRMYLFSIIFLFSQCMAMENSGLYYLSELCSGELKSFTASDRADTEPEGTDIKNEEDFKDRLNYIFAQKNPIYRARRLNEMIDANPTSLFIDLVNKTPLNREGARLIHLVAQNCYASSFKRLGEIPGVDFDVTDYVGRNVIWYAQFNVNKSRSPACLRLIGPIRKKRKIKEKAY